MRTVFVAGAGTDIGKTYVACALVRALRRKGRRVAAVKPVASGVGPWDAPAFAISDTARLLDALGLPPTRANVDACTPWRFAAALSPDMAARREGRSLHLRDLLGAHARAVACTPADGVLVVEGAGGLMSPVTEDATGLDWLKAIDAEVLLVAGSYLGAISHALTASETLLRHGRPAACIVLSEGADPPVPVEETAEAVARRVAAPVLVVPRGGGFPHLPAFLEAGRPA